MRGHKRPELRQIVLIGFRQLELGRAREGPAGAPGPFSPRQREVGKRGVASIGAGHDQKAPLSERRSDPPQLFSTYRVRVNAGIPSQPGGGGTPFAS